MIITEKGIHSLEENVSPHNRIICETPKIQICLFSNEEAKFTVLLPIRFNCVLFMDIDVTTDINRKCL